MGDYSDDAIDRDLHIWLGYDKDDDDDDETDDDGYPGRRRSRRPVTYIKLEFKSIKRETEKAWCLIMMGDAEYWFPKSQCSISGNMISIPDWLKDKRVVAEALKIILKNKP